MPRPTTVRRRPPVARAADPRSTLASATLALALAGGGCAAPAPRPDLAAIERTVVVGTDVAQIALLDPSALSGHAHDPRGWWYLAPVTEEDRSEGRFLFVGTGSDGGYAVRVTGGELLAAERERAGPSVRLRVAAGDEGLLLDGGDAWPFGGREPNRRFAEALPVPAGAYAATITSVAAWREDGTPTVADEDGRAALPDYVLQLAPIASVERAPRMERQVRLSAYAPTLERPFERGVDVEERCGDAPEAVLPVVVGERPLPIPGRHASLSLDAEARARALTAWLEGDGA